MPLSYANVPLLLHDPSGAANDHIRRYLDERMASIFTPELTCYTDDRSGPRTNNSQPSIQQVGLPVPNYPSQPRPKINTLYWPTGATRWAQGLFLIDGENLTRINNAMATSGLYNKANTPQSFKMSTPEIGDDGLSSSLYMLPPRPVSPKNTPSDQRLWILPLVDVRYFWQFSAVSVFASCGWSDLFSQLGTALGVTLSVGAVSGNYFYPDPVEWRRDYENAAMLLDAACHTVGMRFVRNTIGDCYVMNSTLSATKLAGNLTNTSRQEIAGGDMSSLGFASMVPGNVIVTYRNGDNSNIKGVDTVAATISPNDPNWEKVFHTTALQSRTSTGLSGQIASDYYSWLTTRYDYDSAGILSWQPGGFDDFILWEYGVKKGRQKEYHAQTRSQSMPYNFGVTNLPITFTNPCSTSSSSSSISSSSNSGSSGSGSGSASTSGACGCVPVVTGVSCSGGSLVVTYGQARGCC